MLPDGDNFAGDLCALGQHGLAVDLDGGGQTSDESITLVVLVALERLTHDGRDRRALWHGDHVPRRLRCLGGDRNHLGCVSLCFSGSRRGLFDRGRLGGLVRGCGVGLAGAACNTDKACGCHSKV